MRTCSWHNENGVTLKSAWVIERKRLIAPRIPLGLDLRRLVSNNTRDAPCSQRQPATRGSPNHFDKGDVSHLE